jgi:hypothetical protein
VPAESVWVVVSETVPPATERMRRSTKSPKTKAPLPTPMLQSWAAAGRAARVRNSARVRFFFMTGGQNCNPGASNGKSFRPKTATGRMRLFSQALRVSCLITETSAVVAEERRRFRDYFEVVGKSWQ